MQIHPAQITSLKGRSLHATTSLKHSSQPSFGEEAHGIEADLTTIRSNYATDIKQAKETRWEENKLAIYKAAYNRQADAYERIIREQAESLKFLSSLISSLRGDVSKLTDSTVAAHQLAIMMAALRGADNGVNVNDLLKRAFGDGTSNLARVARQMIETPVK